MRDILIVVDLQEDFKVEPYYSKIINYIKNNKDKYDQIIATRFINTPDSPFVQKLNYDGAMTRSKLEFSYNILFGKHTYGCGSGFYKYLKEDNIYIVGCDTDACILAMCYEMFKYNMNFYILSKYCYSSGGEEFHKSAIDIIKRNFGENTIVE